MIHQSILENGLRIALEPDPTALVTSIVFWFETGVIDEQPGEEGIAHFLEHLWFKGGARLGAAAAAIELLGGDLQAHTGYDHTVVHATVLASQVTAALEVFAGLILHSTWTESDVESEKLVILEEIASYAEDPDVVLEEFAQTRMFPDHPYGRAILGTTEQVSTRTYEQLRDFQHRHHGSNRAIVAIVGDFETESIRTVLSTLFSNWRPSLPRQALPAIQPPGSHIECLSEAFSSTTVHLVWPFPPQHHPDAPALEILTSALTDGAASLILQRLENDGDFASDTRSELSWNLVSSCWSLRFTPRDGQAVPAIDAALHTLMDVVESGLPGQLLVRARDMLLADELFGLEDVDDRAHQLAESIATGCSPIHRRYSLAVMTSSSVYLAAKRWLDPKNASVFVLDSSVQATDIQQVVDPYTTRTTLAMESSSPSIHTLTNGVRIILYPKDTPIVAVEALTFGGKILESPELAGIGSAWQQAIGMSTNEYDATAYAEALDAISATLEAAAGRNSLAVRTTFPALWTREGLELFAATLVEPALKRRDWLRIRETLLDDHRTLSDRPIEIAQNALYTALWPNHPWSVLGSPAIIRQWQPRTLLDWHHRQFTGEHLVVAIAGGFSPKMALDVLIPHLERLVHHHLTPTRPSPSPISPQSIVRTAGRDQVHLLLGTRYLTNSIQTIFTLSFVAMALESQSGRLFIRLREQSAYAYDVWAHSVSGADGGVFSVGLTTDLSRATEAEAALQSVIDSLLYEGLTSEEFERYRRMWQGLVATDLQHVAGIASALAFGNLFGGPIQLIEHQQWLERQTTADIHQLLRTTLTESWVTVRVGPE